MKGPGGLAEFYIVLLAYVAIARKWRVLIAPGHLLMIVIAFAPIAWWVHAVRIHSGIPPDALNRLWANQTGVDAVAHNDAAQWKRLLIDHYATFPFRVFMMLLPWSLWAIPATGRFFGRELIAMASGRTKLGHLWLLLAASAPALLIVFWIWPKANPRYMMMVAFPVASLVAMFIAFLPRWRLFPAVAPLFRAIAMWLVLAVPVGAMVAVIVAWRISPDALVSAIAVAIVASALAWIALRQTARTPLDSAALALACNLAIVMLLGRGLVSAVFLPYQAKRDFARIVHNQMDAIVPRDRPVYTTRTLLSGNGEDYYNLQFYLPRTGGGPFALSDLAKLPAGNVTVILSPEELPALKATGVEIRELGELHAPKGPPGVLAVEVSR
jgi:hypothetical protein